MYSIPIVFHTSFVDCMIPYVLIQFFGQWLWCTCSTDLTYWGVSGYLQSQYNQPPPTDRLMSLSLSIQEPPSLPWGVCACGCACTCVRVRVHARACVRG